MDRRDMMAEYPPDREGFVEATMSWNIEVTDEETDEKELISLPAKYDVCGTCNGKGSHVNPSIDAHGISPEEFDEDPDFREEYLSGMYDVDCYECHGKRVVPVIDERACCTPKQKYALRCFQRRALDDAEDARVSYYERMSGA